MNDGFLNSKALARRLGVTSETVRAWFRRGWIPAYRAGRRPLMFDVDAVEDALAHRACSSSHAAALNPQYPHPEAGDR